MSDAPCNCRQVVRRSARCVDIHSYVKAQRVVQLDRGHDGWQVGNELSYHDSAAYECGGGKFILMHCVICTVVTHRSARLVGLRACGTFTYCLVF